MFLSLTWDSGVNLPERSIPFNRTASIENLVKWGRASWLSFYNGINRGKDFGKKEHMDAYILKKIIMFAVEKLREPGMSQRFYETELGREESSLTIFAILAI